MVMVPDPFQARDEGAEELHGDPTAPRSGPGMKYGRSSAKGGAPKRLRWGQSRSRATGAARISLPFYPA